MLFLDSIDRLCFEDVLTTAVPRAGFELLSYCLMGTHYHLLIQTPEANIGAGMKRLNWLYAWRFNRRHGGKGHAFESRYGAKLIADESHLLSTVRYIVRNPVRAGLTPTPLGWRWSSYGPTIGARPCPPFLSPAPVLSPIPSRAAPGPGRAPRVRGAPRTRGGRLIVGVRAGV